MLRVSVISEGGWPTSIEPGNRAPLLVDVRHDRRVVAHRCHVMTDDIFSKRLKAQEQSLHLEKIDVQQLFLVQPHPGHVLIEEVSAPPRTRHVRIQVKIRSRCPESNPRQQMIPHHPPKQIPSHFPWQRHRKRGRV